MWEDAGTLILMKKKKKEEKKNQTKAKKVAYTRRKRTPLVFPHQYRGHM